MGSPIQRSTIGALAAASLIFAAEPAAAQATNVVWATPDMFWYPRPVPGGTMWMRVDARNGSHEFLFDHTRLASDLSVKLETRIDPLALPFAGRDVYFRVKFDGSNAAMQSGAMAIEFAYGGELWRCDMQGEWDWGRASDYECNSKGAFDRFDEPLRDTDPRPSPDGRWEALVVNNNVVVRRAGTTGTRALSTDGTPASAYHAGSIRWSEDSVTISAYRVDSAIWTTARPGASVNQYLTKAQWRIP
jgi:hypothetical protein